MSQHNQNQSAGTSSRSMAEKYQRFFVPTIGRPIADDLIEVAALHAGERVLDVGCGTGVVTRLAAGLVGGRALVSGVDVNPEMIEVARASTSDQVHIDWYEASAESMPFPDASFDVVLCQMTLQFVPDRLAALREMLRVLAPGGRLALNAPGPIPRPFADLAETLQERIGPEAAGFVRGVFALDDENELRELLASAGFRGIEVWSETKDLSTPPARDFLWQYVHSTPLAAKVLQAPDKSVEEMEDAIASRWRKFESNGGMAIEVGMITATALK